jgi:hypothetical protein
VIAWRQQLENGNGNRPDDWAAVIAKVEKLRAGLPSDSLRYAELTTALDALKRAAEGDRA